MANRKIASATTSGAERAQYAIRCKLAGGAGWPLRRGWTQLLTSGCSNCQISSDTYPSLSRGGRRTAACGTVL